MSKAFLVAALFAFFVSPAAGASGRHEIHKALAELRSATAADRINGAVTLGRLGARRATPDLIELLSSDPDSRVRAASAEALGRISDARAVRALVEAVENDRAARVMSIRALALIADGGAVPVMVRMLSDSSAAVVTEAAQALQAFPGQEVTSALVSALKRAGPATCPAIATVLGRRGAAEAVGPLAQVAKREQTGPICRLSAIEALGWIGDPKAAPLLMNLAGESGPVSIQRAALEALGRLPTTAAVPLIIRKLEHADAGIRLSALDALIRIGDPSAISAIAGRLDDPNAEVRAAADLAIAHLSPSN